MKKGMGVFLVMAGLFLGVSPALAERPSAELGKGHFDDPALGASKNSLSCSSCHPNGDGMEKAGSNPQLDAVINRCILGPLKGKALPVNSSAMQSLKMYIESLAE